MNIIAVIITQDECLIVEADYLLLCLDLERRVGSSAEQIRPGLGSVDVPKASQYAKHMRQFALDADSLEADWRSMTAEERAENREEFLPTVVVDFPTRTFRVNHPEAVYLNLEEYVPPGWTTSEEVLQAIPHDCRYWTDWPDIESRTED